jgi:hypothetical protein
MADNNTGNIFKETIGALLSIIEVYDSSLKEN